MSDYPIRAYKMIKTDSGPAQVGCPASDPEAHEFIIRYQPIGANFMSDLRFEKLSQAEQVRRALFAAHNDGRKAAFADLRTLIGA